MANFVIRVILEPHPWPFRWGPWGRARQFVSFEMDDGQVLIWQRDKKGQDGMTDEPMSVAFSTGRLSCLTTVEQLGGVGGKTSPSFHVVHRRTRL